MSINVCYGPPMEEGNREHIEERWCFYERKRVMFDYVVMVPTEPSYYGPYPKIECTSCGKVDTDLFPGRVREWSDDE